MKKITFIAIMIIISAHKVVAQYSMIELQEIIPLTQSYPIIDYKDPDKYNLDSNWKWGWMKQEEINKLRAIKFLDMQGKIVDNRTTGNIIAGRRYRPIPTNLCPDVFSIEVTIGRDLRREILAVYKGNSLCDTVETFMCGSSRHVSGHEIIVKQSKLEHGGKLTVYELYPTTSTPLIFETMSDSQKVTAQRKDITYQLNVESGKFVKTSETLYYPQEYEISYYGTNGSDIWEGTETKIGTITY